MILDTTGNGPLGIAIRGALRGMAGEELRVARGDDPDLFMHALGCRSIVCAAGESLLEGKLDPSPSPERMKAIVRAAHAPGVKLVAVVVPAGEHYVEEERVLKKDGVPYVILRCAPLVEELAEAANFHVSGALWLARGKTVSIATASDLAGAVVRALDDGSWQGDTIDVPSQRVDLTEAVRRAARVAGAKTKVRAASPTLSAVFGRVSGWLGMAKPPAAALYERMLAAGG